MHRYKQCFLSRQLIPVSSFGWTQHGTTQPAATGNEEVSELDLAYMHFKEDHMTSTLFILLHISDNVYITDFSKIDYT